MLPDRLIFKFWMDVVTELVQTHRLKVQAATAAVQAYRDLVDAHDTGAPNYNRGVESVAETVAAGWKSGFLKWPAAARTP